MHVICLVRCGRKYRIGCKYHTNQSYRILLTHYFFFTSGMGQHFDLSPPAVQWVTMRLLLTSGHGCTDDSAEWIVYRCKGAEL